MNEKVINLFAELDSEILQHKIKVEDNKIKAVYDLGDGSCYYAIFPTEEELVKQIGTFQNIPNVVLSADAVRNMLEVVLHNCEVYYQIQEYVRYEKNTTDTKTSVYEATYLNIKQNILGQLQFLATLTPLLHKEFSPNFPNLEYKDVPPEEFYTNNPALDEKDENKQRVVMRILASTVPTAITTKDILQVEYTQNELTELRQMTMQDTNTDKLENYITLRKSELDELAAGEMIHAKMTKDPSSLFKDVNTVFDLHTAALISDKIYQKGQGVFAISDFVLQGRTVRFTSQHDARHLASEVDHDLYKTLLLKNILLNLLIEKDNHAYDKLRMLLQQEKVTIEQVSELVFNNMPLLMLAVDNFNYDLLNYTKNTTQQVLAIFENDNLEIMERNIKNLLQNMKAL